MKLLPFIKVVNFEPVGMKSLLTEPYKSTPENFALNTTLNPYYKN